MICFCHIAKTAGTTLHYSMRQNYGTNYVEFLKIPGLRDQVAFLRLLKRLRPNLAGIGGHHLRACPEFREVCPDMQFFTFLRDPVRRFFSWHRSKIVRGVIDDSIAARSRVLHQQDYQTKFLIGCRTGPSRDFVAGPSELEEAKRILLRDYHFVGFVEEYDESLLLMKTVLGLAGFDARYEQRNVLGSADALDAVSAEDRLRMEEANRLDIELYRFARQTIWPRQLERHGGNLPAEVEAFRAANAGFRFSRSRLMRYRLAKHALYTPLSKAVQMRSGRTGGEPLLRVDDGANCKAQQ